MKHLNPDGKPLRSITDMFSLMPPLHIPTLPISPIHAFDANVRFGAEATIDRTASMGAKRPSIVCLAKVPFG